MALVNPYVPTYHNLPVTFTPTDTNTTSNATVHYVSAGSPSFPPLVLLHGFPSSSSQYRDFIPLLADSYHVLAPDLPGFGLTQVPQNFTYTFSNLAAVTSAWLQALNLTSYALYIFDYGAPVGLRIATQNPSSVKALISQNGNAYTAGFGQEFWQPVFNLWNTSNAPSARQALANDVLTLPATQYQYLAGVPDPDVPLSNPQSWTVDYLQNIHGDGKMRIQLDLFYDYRTNVELYPAFQAYFRASGVPILAVWGKGDPAFVPAGAEAFRGDSPGAVVRFVDAGHFALETKRWEIARIVREWLAGVRY